MTCSPLWQPSLHKRCWEATSPLRPKPCRIRGAGLWLSRGSEAAARYAPFALMLVGFLQRGRRLQEAACIDMAFIPEQEAYIDLLAHNQFSGGFL